MMGGCPYHSVVQNKESETGTHIHLYAFLRCRRDDVWHPGIYQTAAATSNEGSGVSISRQPVSPFQMPKCSFCGPSFEHQANAKEGLERESAKAGARPSRISS